MTRNSDLTPATLAPWKQRLVWARRTAKKANALVDRIQASGLIRYWRSCGVDYATCFYCRHRASKRLGVLLPYRRGGGLTKINLVPTCDYCDDWVESLSFEERAAVLLRFKVGAGLFPPPKTPRVPVALYGAEMKHPVTEADWDLWTKQQRAKKKAAATDAP